MLRLQETPLSATPIGAAPFQAPHLAPGGPRSQSNFYWKQIRQRKVIRDGQQPRHPATVPLTHKGQTSVQGGQGDTIRAVLAALWLVDGHGVDSPSSPALWNTWVASGPKLLGRCIHPPTWVCTPKTGHSQ